MQYAYQTFAIIVQEFVFDKSMVEKIGPAAFANSKRRKTASNHHAQFPPYKCLSAVLHSQMHQNRAPEIFSPHDGPRLDGADL
jgi:hypothetical protein